MALVRCGASLWPTSSVLLQVLRSVLHTCPMVRIYMSFHLVFFSWEQPLFRYYYILNGSIVSDWSVPGHIWNGILEGGGGYCLGRRGGGRQGEVAAGKMEDCGEKEDGGDNDYHVIIVGYLTTTTNYSYHHLLFLLLDLIIAHF